MNMELQTQVGYKAEFNSIETELSYQDGRWIEEPQEQVVLDYWFPETMAIADIKRQIGKTITRYSVKFRLAGVWPVETDCPF